MNHQKDDNLERLLKDWAVAGQPDQAHLDTLHERISRAADELEGANQLEGARAEVIDCTKTVPSATWPGRLVWFALGAAAAILAAVLLVSWLGPDRPVAVPQRQLAGLPAAARLDRQQLAAQSTLFGAMQEVFAGRLTWMAETDGKVILGIEPEGEASPADSEAITVRLVVMSRRRGESDWHTRWNVDCIVHNEQLVELAAADGSENRLALWTHLLPDGMIAVDTSLGIEGPNGRASSSSGVQRPQVPQRILDLRTERSEYRVFQTVAVLPKEVG